MALLISNFQSEILNVVNNQNHSSKVLLWVQTVLREIRAKARWGWLKTFKIRDWPSGLVGMPLPDDFSEVCDPLYRNTILAAPGAYTGVWDSTTSFSAGAVVFCSLDNLFYSAVIANSGKPP